MNAELFSVNDFREACCRLYAPRSKFRNQHQMSLSCLSTNIFGGVQTSLNLNNEWFATPPTTHKFQYNTNCFNNTDLINIYSIRGIKHLGEFDCIFILTQLTFFGESIPNKKTKGTIKHNLLRQHTTQSTHYIETLHFTNQSFLRKQSCQ